MIKLRPYQPQDALVLLALFRETVQRVNIADYSPEQIQAWASPEIDPLAWTARFTDRFAIVAEEHQQPVGFADLEFNGHLDRLFVSATHQRQGIGQKLLLSIVAEAKRLRLPRLFTEASITARPFFAANGFTILKEQTVTLRQVDFINYRMELLLQR